jgi:hypothetical protein
MGRASHLYESTIFIMRVGFFNSVLKFALSPLVANFVSLL